MTYNNTIITLRQDTSANWYNNNPTLSAGELAFETTGKTIRVGDGSNTWRNLKSLVDTTTISTYITPINNSISALQSTDTAQDASISSVTTRVTAIESELTGISTILTKILS